MSLNSLIGWQEMLKKIKLLHTNPLLITLKLKKASHVR